MKVAIIDYGMGNLGSVRRALGELGAETSIIDNPADMASADRIILPGVGSFTDGMSNLRRAGWETSLIRQTREIGTPLLGICLGMQLLAETGLEGSDGTPTRGLGLIPGEILRLDAIGCRLRIPHVGWNALSPRVAAPLLAGLPEQTDFYFVHSFAFAASNPAHVLATAEYGIQFAAVVGCGNVAGTQFHPEKSSRAGFKLLKNFLQGSPC